MLVFDEEWNRRELWKKSAGKMVKLPFLGKFRRPVPVHL